MNGTRTFMGGAVVIPVILEICTAPEMIPTLKWSSNRLRNDPNFYSRRPRNHPQLILGMEELLAQNRQDWRTFVAALHAAGR